MKLLFTIDDTKDGNDSLFAWQTTGNHLAVSFSKNKVVVVDRHGEQAAELSLSGSALNICWDKDGDLLAVISEQSNHILLWDINTKRTQHVDSGMSANDALTMACWSPASSILAVGNNKGNLLLYNHQNQRRETVIGKHTKQITCGAFSRRDMLALGGQDQQVTVSSNDGELMHSFACNANPAQIQFGDMKANERQNASQIDNSISAVIGKRILMLIDMNEPDNLINLQFQARYGDIMAHKWFGDGYILIGFEHGYLVSISTHSSEMGSEIFSIQEHKSYISDVNVSQSFQKIYSAGDNCVKLRELNSMSQMYAIVEMDGEDMGLNAVQLNADGQLMAVSGKSGCLSVYLTKLPVLGCSCGTRLAVLSSLMEITVYGHPEQEPTITFAVDVEPAFVGVGTAHVAVGMNNRAAFYLVTRQGAQLVREFEYLGSVVSLSLNDNYAAALLEGRVQLHRIDSSASPRSMDGKVFPESDKSQYRILCMALTESFLIIGTEAGHIHYFFLEDWKVVNEYKHVAGIKSVYPDSTGSRLCVLDQKRELFVYSAVNDSVLVVPQQSLTTAVHNVLWDNSPNHKDVFVVYDSQHLFTYIYEREHLQGAEVKYVGDSKLPYGHVPLLINNGEVTCQTQSGRVSTVALDTHQFDPQIDRKTEQETLDHLDSCLKLKRWLNAWRICEHKKDKVMWKRFGQAALESLNVQLAVRVFRQLKDVGMVWALEELLDIEDRHLLTGHVAMILERFDLAEKSYLQSSEPLEALEMRRDLLHWERALQLATRLAPEQVALISKEYAQQLEFMGEYGNALTHFEQGILDDIPENKVHNEACEAGIARMCLRQGDIHRGVQLASQSSSRAFKKQCAQILELIKQYNEAAQLYQQAQFYDRAAAVCIKAKNWMKVGELLPKVHSPKIHAQYAKAMEAEKKYKPAAEAYKNAKDYDNLTRILLEHLNDPEEAVRVVRQSKSVDGAKLVAKFFINIGDHNSAIQFLVISQCLDDGFRLAEQHNQMDTFADVVGEEASPEMYDRIAQYYQAKHNPFMAGKFFFLAGQYDTALGHLLSSGEDVESLKLAIDCVAKANNPALTKKLIAFLLGEVDGVPKDCKYLFRLYVALQMFSEAARVAVVIARNEQDNGSYRLAHVLLLGMCSDLRTHSIRVPNDLHNSLMLLHSYLISRQLIKRNEHMRAARMLIRVSNSISRFPAHAVSILMSALIECSKVSLKVQAYKLATQLIRPEYKKKIEEIDDEKKKYKKRIETIVRKQDPNSTEPEEERTPCPFCQTLLRETELSCAECKNSLPYCIVTGRHVVVDDLTMCVHCKFPAYLSEFKKLLEAGENCPMCTEKCELSDLKQLDSINEVTLT